MDVNNIKIDLVYTWVDGDDPEYQRELRRYVNDPVGLNPERYRDVYQTLKYSMRSVEKYAPWIHRIHIVTCRPQIPDWLDVNHPKIHVVHHDEIFESDEFLPTFNSHAIACFLHRIPTLSDYFIYMCDDWLLGKAVTPETFMTESGRIKIYGTLAGRLTNFKLHARIRKMGHYAHCPIFVYRPYWLDMMDEWREPLNGTKKSRFRAKQDISPVSLSRYYFLSKPNIKTKAISLFGHMKEYQFHKIMNGYKTQKRRIRKLRQKQPRFFCLNDDQKDEPCPRVMEPIKNFLEEMYPEKSGYEK